MLMGSPWWETEEYLCRWLRGGAELEALAASAVGSAEKTEELFSAWAEMRAGAIMEEDVLGQNGGGADDWGALLSRANGGELGWMDGYGMPVCGAERDTARFVFGCAPDVLAGIGAHIADAFLHGFVSQSRDRRGRRRVRLHYCVGMEAVAQAVCAALRSRGLEPVVQKPDCLAWSGSYASLHRQDRAAALSEKALDELCGAYAAACRRHEDALRDTCGMIGIGQFGAETGTAPRPAERYAPSPERIARLVRLEDSLRETDAEYLAPSDLSFCKVAFPNAQVGESFPEVFGAFCRINTMESEPYERIQQRIIDALDGCACAELKGVPGNGTDLRVMFRPLAEPGKQTNFLNCGGDLNVPHGELFTTPVLRGTNGTLHVKEIYLKDAGFRDLRLTFRDGMIADYGCGGFASPEEGRAFVGERLLGGRDTLPMGEFAIGTNTLAYRTARELGLMPRLPILLAEKMGPHVAVGDPCFARGEDAPVYNLYDGKEMTARENERTARRAEGGAYTNVHTDITLAFDELSYLDGVRSDGSRVRIIENGRFALPGTELLNAALDERDGHGRK